ncbi:MoxR like protein [gamma proteobacterium HdN1]|nr:MoxR like protein [gamma proteobacterium HdN1]
MHADAIKRVLQQVGQIVLGKPHEVKLAVACLIARGHLLIEDLPGMGKTTLAHALAGALGLSFQRVQFTSDLLPSDVLGVSIYRQDLQGFEFRQGPIFTQILLADEINRTTPKTQSALLEAMEERQVSVEGETRSLPVPFFVIATQNPFTQMGTYPLPESQMDRFLMCISLGYPDQAIERALLRGEDQRKLLTDLKPATSAEQLLRWQQAVGEIKLSDAVLDYIQKLVRATRHHERIEVGLSPRGAIALTRAAQAWALLEARDYLIPDDVQAVFQAVVSHRLFCASDQGGHREGRMMAREILAATDVLGHL